MTEAPERYFPERLCESYSVPTLTFYTYADKHNSLLSYISATWTFPKLRFLFPKSLQEVDSYSVGKSVDNYECCSDNCQELTELNFSHCNSPCML